ncbi:MAG: hypothetical protein VXV96_14675 [Bdellovibrionota bacterium]|nr:hypothetical protein [Bdellovibrionota bacterium]
MKTAPVHAKAYFDSKAGCEKAIRSGLQFQWSDTSKIKIHPKASDNINSVTDNCSNEAVLVCSANTDHLSVPFIH